MKVWTVVCFSALSLALPLGAQPAAKPAGIPAAAVKAGDSYRYTDAQGRQWIYRQTPFGVSRTPAEDNAAKTAPAQPKPGDNIRATDHGDTVRFERPGPFGMYRWERKKSDLDAAERAALERQAGADQDRK